MPRGGRRPGAGAPKGNTNALRRAKYTDRYVIACAAFDALAGRPHDLWFHETLRKIPDELERAARANDVITVKRLAIEFAFEHLLDAPPVQPETIKPIIKRAALPESDTPPSALPPASPPAPE